MVREIPQHLRCDVHLKVALRWKLDKKDPRLELIKRAGFDWIQQMENFNLDIDLIRFFYSRFRKDLGTFDLGNEKYMITLEDVLNLTGLTIAGDAIVWKEDKDTNKLCEKYLGKVPKETEKVGGKVKLEWLRDNFQKLKKNASLKDVENSARAYLLHTIGAFIFPDGSGAMVSSIYLTFLDDFDKAKTFSWGSAMLTQLITNLQKDPSKKGNVNLSGNAALLMYWVYERFPDFRPEGVGLVNRVVPLMVGWTRKIRNSSLNVYKDCRMDYYEELANEENIRYSSILDVEYPPHLSHLKNQKNLAKVDVPLFHGSTCFIYRPSCCPHQFEDVPACQSTPPLPSAFKPKQKKSRKGPQGNVDWHVEHGDLLTLWNMQRLETVSCSIDEFEEEIPVQKYSKAQTLPHDSFKSCDYSLFASTAANLIEEKDTRIKQLEKQVAQLQTTLEEKEQLVLLHKDKEKELEDKNAELQEARVNIFLQLLEARVDAESKLSEVKMQYAKNSDSRIKHLEKQVGLLQSTLEEKEQLVLLYKYRDKELKDKNAEFLKALFGAESKLSKVKMQYAKQLEFSRDVKELCQRNDQAINDIWREIGFEKLESVTTEKLESVTTEKEADKAVQDMERKCDQKLAEHKEESHQYLMRLPEEHAALEDGPAPMHSSALKDGGGSSGLSVKDAEELQQPFS